VKKVRISFCTVVCTSFRMLHAIDVIYIKEVDSKASGENTKVQTTKTGGSDPGNFGLSRPKLCAGSLPPMLFAPEHSENSQRREATKFACAD